MSSLYNLATITEVLLVSSHDEFKAAAMVCIELAGLAIYCGFFPLTTIYFSLSFDIYAFETIRNYSS